MNTISINSDSNCFNRKLQMKIFFHDKVFNDESLISNKSTKTFITQNAELLEIVHEEGHLEPIKQAQRAQPKYLPI